MEKHAQIYLSVRLRLTEVVDILKERIYAVVTGLLAIYFGRPKPQLAHSLKIRTSLQIPTSSLATFRNVLGDWKNIYLQFTLTRLQTPSTRLSR